MRRLLSIFSSFAVVLSLCYCLTGCNHLDEAALFVQQRREVRFTFSVAGTKAPATGSEEDVLTVDVFVFRQKDGALDARLTSQGLGPVAVDVLSGLAMDWVVVANAPSSSLDGVTSLADLLSRKVMLEDNTMNSLVMFDRGSWGVEGPVGMITVNLRRYVSKVTVQSLRLQWLDAFSTAPEVILKQIALINVNGSIGFDGLPSCGTVWYNRLGVETGLSSSLARMVSVPFGLQLHDSSPICVDSPLYAMPNPVSTVRESDTAPLWSERATMIVVELFVDGYPNWYSVALPSMACNCHYVVNNLVITGPGSPVAGGRIERQPVQCEIVVSPWDEATSGVVFPVN